MHSLIDVGKWRSLTTLYGGFMKGEKKLKELCSFPLLEGVKLHIQGIGSVVPMLHVFKGKAGSRCIVCLQKQDGTKWGESILPFNELLLARRATEALRDFPGRENPEIIKDEKSLCGMIEAVQYYDQYNCLSIKQAEKIIPEDEELAKLRKKRMPQMLRALDRMKKLRLRRMKRWLVGKLEEKIAGLAKYIKNKEKEIARRVSGKLANTLSRPLDFAWAFEKLCLIERCELYVNLDDIMQELRRNPDERLLEIAEIRARNLLIAAVKKPR